MHAKLKLLIISLLLHFASMATVHTINNNLNSQAQFTTLQSAYVAANPGDTLMVSGSAIVYQLSSISWDKNLIVIGSGFNSDKQLFKEVKFGPNTFLIGDSSKFYGIRFMGNINFTANVSGLYFESCRFDGDIWPGTYDLSNLTVLNSVFNSAASNLKIDLTNCSTVLLSHCVLNGIITGSNNNFNFGVSVDHCVFLNNNVCFSNVYNIVVTNSIFNGNNTPITDVYNSSFHHCLVKDSIANYWASNGNTSINNIENQNPLFENVTTNSWNTAMNFHLQNGSPAIGSGSGGSDMGLHDTGSTFSNYGEPKNIPVIRKMNVLNTSVPQSGSVNVEVKSTKAREN